MTPCYRKAAGSGHYWDVDDTFYSGVAVRGTVSLS